MASIGIWIHTAIISTYYSVTYHPNVAPFVAPSFFIAVLDRLVRSHLFTI